MTTNHSPVRVPDLLLRRIHDEFHEMPGLQLTLPQARRLFGLTEQECTAALATLVAAGVLVMLPGGIYARPTAEAASRHRGTVARFA